MKVKLLYHDYSFWVKCLLALIIISTKLLPRIISLEVYAEILIDIWDYSSKIFLILFIVGFLPVFDRIKMLIRLKCKGLLDKENQVELSQENIALARKMNSGVTTYVPVKGYKSAEISYNKILIIGDDLKNVLTDSELSAIIAHELAHDIRSLIQTLVLIIGALITFIVICIINFNDFFTNIVINISCIYIIMPLFIWFRELDSDIYAINYVSKDDLQGGLIKYVGEYVNRYSFTHPSVKFRVGLLEKKMKLPENPWDVFCFIIIIALIGASPTVLIHFLSSLKIWNLVRPFFSTSAWHYFNWWATAYPEPAAAFLAIYIAFAVEKRAKEKQFQKRVREIVPHIYIELIENSFLIREAKDFHTFQYKQRKFRTQAWRIYSQEISKWQEINVVPLKRIYPDLDLINNSGIALNKIPLEISDAKRRAGVLIPNQISVYEKWYKKNNLAIEELQNVLSIYEGIAGINTLESKVVAWVKQFLKDAFPEDG